MSFVHVAVDVVDAVGGVFPFGFGGQAEFCVEEYAVEVDGRTIAIDGANEFAHFAGGEHVCVQRVGILFDGFVDGLQRAERNDAFGDQLIFVDAVGTPSAVVLRLFPRNADNGIIAESDVCVVVACERFVVGQLFAPNGFVGHGEQNFSRFVRPYAANPCHIFAPVEVGYFVFVQEVTAVADAAFGIVVRP